MNAKAETKLPIKEYEQQEMNPMCGNDFIAFYFNYVFFI